MRFDRFDRIVQQGTVFYFFVITMGAFIVAVQNIAFLKSLKNNTNWSKCNESDWLEITYDQFHICCLPQLLSRSPYQNLLFHYGVLLLRDLHPCLQSNTHKNNMNEYLYSVYLLFSHFFNSFRL